MICSVRSPKHMSQSRLFLAVANFGLTVPVVGRIAVFAPRTGYDLSLFQPERCDVIQPFKPCYDAFASEGYRSVLREVGPYALAAVILPRAKALSRDLIARAAAVSTCVIVDGQKTDGIDSILKEVRKRCTVQQVVSKAHGKTFWFTGGCFSDWRAIDQQKIEDKYVTRPGLFSADGIDPASRILIEALPKNLGKSVVDLGAGWGFLSHEVLKREGIQRVDLVEADHDALDCARRNIEDKRAGFYWADAVQWTGVGRYDTVISNPPFHSGRKSEPELGIRFIEAAANLLSPSGHLWMVANRHLPYETALQAAFVHFEEVAGNNKFKVLHAYRPARKQP